MGGAGEGETCLRGGDLTTFFYIVVTRYPFRQKKGGTRGEGEKGETPLGL